MIRRIGSAKNRQRGMGLYVVIMTMFVFAILSHNLVHQALMDYHQGAMMRDSIVLEHLTDSALGQATYYLNRGDRKAAAAPLRETTGVARIELDEKDEYVTVRIVACTPNETMPRMSSQTAYRLARDAQGRWRATAAERESLLSGKGQ